ncbi:hypothetical protein ACWCO3_23220 [Micromonospora sp. NPDC002411]
MRTAEASKGEADPIAAANAYLLAAFAEYGDGLGIERCLCDSRRKDLLKEASKMRDQLSAAGTGIKVVSSDWKEIDSDGMVSAQISLRFTSVDAAGRTMFLAGSRHEWRFQTKEERGMDRGWKVCRVDAPSLCGNHLRC